MTANTPDLPPCEGITPESGPKIGVIYNPRSHRNRGRDLDCVASARVMVEQPATRHDITAALQKFAQEKIAYLIINGGDGTVRDVLTCGGAVFAGEWPEIAVLPKGKTNALNVDLGAPADWNLDAAIGSLAGGKRIKRHTLKVEVADGSHQPRLGFILGAGGFTLGVHAGQDAHRMGAFNSLAVGAATAWGVMQGLFGGDRNVWRQGVAIRLKLGPDGREAARSKYGDRTRRFVMMSSTLEKFPVGIKLFGREKSGLKIALIDHPRRRIMALLPVILAGWNPAWLAQAGVHFLTVENYVLDIENEFILDGEAYAAGRYAVSKGPELSFVVPQ
ncbi:diacylglycerol kinase family protein [Pontixanthobacter sp.]|uniref:diacylglycerol kinase family protein n=1 Tax=Pontixanthobacter sp. TaxID=2792078 RepID=UPI003C7B7466